MARNARLIVGSGLVLLSAYFLFGGFFLPPPALIRHGGLVSMPERLLGFWGVGVGLLLILWPRRRKA